MSDINNPSFSPVTIIKNLILFGAFFLISFWALRITVPTESELYINLIAFICALPMAAMTWIAWHMLRCVRLDDKKRKAEKRAASAG